MACNALVCRIIFNVIVGLKLTKIKHDENFYNYGSYFRARATEIGDRPHPQPGFAETPTNWC